MAYRRQRGRSSPRRESPAHGEGPQESSRDGALGDDTPAEGRWIPVPELQQRLAQKAVAEPEHRFGNLYDLLTWESVLDEAADRLLGSPGSRTPGLDGLDRRKLRDKRDHHRDLLRQQLRDGTYQPSPVKRVYIPKKNGKTRHAGHPDALRPLGPDGPQAHPGAHLRERLRRLQPWVSAAALLSHRVGPHPQAHQRARRRRVYWVIEGDIEGCFDHVHHKKRLSLLRRRIRDKRLLAAVWRFLRAGVMEGGSSRRPRRGTPQGGVLTSPTM